MTPADLVLLVGAGFAAGLVGYVTGLASIVSYPALLLVGLSPLSANVTNTVAMVAVGVGSFAKSGRELIDYVGRRSLAASGAAALLGGAVGAGCLLVAPDAVFAVLVPYLVGAASVALLVQPRLRTWIASDADQPVVWLIGVFAVSIYGGYFGAGAGVAFVALALLVTSVPLPKAIIYKSALLGVANAVAAVGFIVFGPVHWTAAAAMGIGCLAGGWAGPPVVDRLPVTPLRITIGLAGLGLAVWLAVSS
ncbi:sulfite exporter TauE/SafE family protein [Gordonia sp. PDNC005]|uniref:sulfite exporter TauE/SafE family protein n=1 Tax=unclassified Gordonia (in: high G+C Gram-positive bacteria) TaxID=2657482 RepID=UPI001964F2E9|nr:sulfite exporter TauE/SafE family protein [Gordonia sp. PDNC005]QRY63119.1 sulfite exporter TauE/SafE family protein [Gordonia sp. PDNC005]